MPDTQPSVPSANTLPPLSAAIEAVAAEDCDFALGCECAYPSLQIERWMQEARADA